MAYPTLQSFLRNLSPPTATGCREWVRSRNNRGYGIVTYWDHDHHCRRSMGAHRMSYILHNPDTTLVDLVLHTCDNPSCCNPDHLRQGTYKENTEDMLAKGRQSRTRRFAPRQRKLTDEQVRAIRHLADTTERTDMDISLLFDVSDSHVRALRLRLRKQHVSEDGPMSPIPKTYARAKITQPISSP